MGALGVGAEGGARISLFLLLRCYSVTKSWKPLLIQAFRRNRIRNAALSATLQNHRPRRLLRDLRSLRRKKPQQQNSSRPAVTQSVTKSVTDDRIGLDCRQTKKGFGPCRSAPVREGPCALRSQFSRPFSATVRKLEFSPIHPPTPPPDQAILETWLAAKFLGDVSTMGLSSHNSV